MSRSILRGKEVAGVMVGDKRGVSGLKKKKRRYGILFRIFGVKILNKPDRRR